ncbi:hypothetical protein EV356DRAFT_538397 [Viridothelium virens]|uniref:Uncharacterized protein n=1 Tax=Viridothelium virens TaxID=1048519 RepID=A0A6A6GRP2_VIRVR|nr:hypothetical protein EV356DRAFT_538397 [Viridothelium virens]
MNDHDDQQKLLDSEEYHSDEFYPNLTTKSDQNQRQSLKPNTSAHHRCIQCASRHALPIITVLLIISFAFNLMLVFTTFRSSIQSENPRLKLNDHSQYLQLPRNISKELPYRSPYWGPNETATNELWNDIEIHPGFVALDREWTDDRGLLQGDSCQNFRWQ